jgi:predicted nucleic acid-binding protein
VALSVVTLAELELGVPVAADASTRARRFATLAGARERVEALPIDDRVASAFAALVAEHRQRGRGMTVQMPGSRPQPLPTTPR